MTNEEAIKDFEQQNKLLLGIRTTGSQETAERNLMAIEALKAQKVGKWIEKSINEWSRKVFCSECGCTAPFEYVSNGDIYSAGVYGVNNKTKFCPNCGARMAESEGK